MRRIALVGASLALLGGMTVACGGSPEDASEGDFCDAMAKVQDTDDFEDTQDAIDELEDVGTPEDISDEGREGFEIMIDISGDSDSDDEANEKLEDLDEDEQKAVSEFLKYESETCK